jgi:hypothetical protein
MKKRFFSVALHALKVWQADKQMRAAEVAAAFDMPVTTYTEYRQGAGRPGIQRRFKIQELTGGAVRAQDWDVPHVPR